MSQRDVSKQFENLSSADLILWNLNNVRKMGFPTSAFARVVLMRPTRIICVVRFFIMFFLYLGRHGGQVESMAEAAWQQEFAIRQKTKQLHVFLQGDIKIIKESEDFI